MPDIGKKSELNSGRLLIIIPAYNEEESIAGVLGDIKGIGVTADVVVIDDASTDRTAAIARDSGCIVLHHCYNMGYGSSLQTGYKYGVQMGYDYIIQMDADGQHDAANIERLWAVLEADEADIVLGSRLLGECPLRLSPLKLLANRIFSSIIGMAAGLRIKDTTTGLQGLGRGAFCYYAGYNHFDDLYPDANMIMQMGLLGFRVREIPALMHERKSGRSMHRGPRPLIYMLRMVFSLIATYLRIRVFRTEGL